MFVKSLAFLLVISAFGNVSGVPLELPSTDMSQFFDSRIVGGIEAPEGIAPHMVALVVGDHFISLICGGSIVSRKLILTAAHCIDMFVIWGELLPTFHGVVGSNRWNNRENSIFFEAFHIHPKWDWATIKNDIGFLVMKNLLVFNKRVAPIPINFEFIEEKENCFVTGWGRLGAMDGVPYMLQKINMTAISHEDCVESINSVPHQGSIRVDRDTEICAFHSIGHGMCHGDSGSALVSRFPLSIIGIVSWGIPCGTGVPDVYTRPSGFKRYILDIIGLWPH